MGNERLYNKAYNWRALVMKNSRIHKIVLGLLCLILLMSGYNLVSAEEKQQQKILQPQRIGSVSLKANVVAEVNNVVLIPSDKGQLIGLTLTIKNNSNTEVNFIDYWLNMTTKSGTKFSLTIANKEVSKIAAKSTKDIVFYGQVGANVKLTDLVVKVLKWDFSNPPSYTKVLGSFSPTQKYIHVTPSGYKRVVSTDENKISFFIKSSTIGKSEKYYRPDIDLVIKNEGKRAVTIPDYELMIQTVDGLMYPLTTKNLKGKVLNPLAEETVQLTASVPLAAKETGWKLAIVSTLNEGKDRIPLALFNLPKPTVSNVEAGVGKTYSFANSNGVYYIKLDSINRLPLDDKDLVISNFTLMNKGNSTLAIPNLMGKYVFNSSIENTTIINNGNKQIDIEPGSSIRLQAVGKVPYSFDIKNMKFTLQQKESDSTEGEILDLVEFTNPGVFNPIVSTDWKTGFKITDTGYKADVAIKYLMSYEGVSNDLAVAAITLNNQEKRQSEMKQLTGYFETLNGAIYPATFMNVSDKLNFSGKAVVYAWTSIPKGMKPDNMSLVVGKAIKEVKTGTAGNESDQQDTVVGFVDPVRVQLPNEREVKGNLQNIDLDPYKLSINQVGTSMRFDLGQLKLRLDYTLEQNLLTKVSAKDQKVVIELVDADHQSKFTKELSFPSSTTVGQGEAASSLKNGVNYIEAEWTDYSWVLNIQVLKDMTFNVYHEFQPGYRTLIASQSIPWLVNRKLPSETSSAE